MPEIDEAIRLLTLCVQYLHYLAVLGTVYGMWRVTWDLFGFVSSLIKD